MSAAPELFPYPSRWPHLGDNTIRLMYHYAAIEGTDPIADLDALNFQRDLNRVVVNGACYGCGVTVERTQLQRMGGFCVTCWARDEDLSDPESFTIYDHPGYVIDDREVSLEHAIKIWNREDEEARSQALVIDSHGGSFHADDTSVVIEEAGSGL